ncbi:hypothetical protein K2X05_06005 [bacterium]|nr:hypothetical protein [bacterium]
MEKSKALIYGVLVDVVLKNNETLVGYIHKEGLQAESERDFVKLSNKKVTKGVRSIVKRFKITQVSAISVSKAKTPSF